MSSRSTDKKLLPLVPCFAVVSVVPLFGVQVLLTVVAQADNSQYAVGTLVIARAIAPTRYLGIVVHTPIMGY